MPTRTLPAGSLKLRQGGGGAMFWEGKFRLDGRQIKRRLGRAWVTADGAPRHGRPRDGCLDEKTAWQALGELIRREAQRTAAERAADAERRRRGPTVAQTAADWLGALEREQRARPSTLRDYRCMLAPPGTPRRRGGGTHKARLLTALGDIPVRRLTASDVQRFLGGLEAEGASARTINKHRQVLHAILAHAVRQGVVETNVVALARKRRETPPRVLEFYEPHEVEAIAAAAAAGAHRGRPAATADEAHWQAFEDHMDAMLIRLAAFTALRRGELLALRWEDVDLDGRRLIVHRAISASTEGPTKGWQARIVPLSDRAASALEALRAREHYTAPGDYVFCTRLGRRLDPSAFRRRYIAAQRAAGARRLTFHQLRHTAGSWIARAGGDPVLIQALLGHSKLSTTERYMHAKVRAEHVELLNRAQDPGIRQTAP